MIVMPSSMKIKSQDKRLFKKISAFAERRGDDRYFKLLGSIWFVQSIKWETESSTGITTFECELFGVIKVKKGKK